MAATTGHVRRLFKPVQGGSLADGKKIGDDLLGDLERVLVYHQRTKHRLERYAASPEALDWGGQPDPFRTFAGAPRTELPLTADRLETPFVSLAEPASVEPHAMTLESIGLLLELSFGLSAWKEYGPDRWSVRCNPSSGNLHPTEAYLICQGMPDLEDGVYHYVSRDHALEQRCTAVPTKSPSAAHLLIGLSSIHWREAWKYGERAFRYCQLDVGHAIGALRYAAAALGWRVRWVEGMSSSDVAHRLGLDRNDDFRGAEAEEAELLLEVAAGWHHERATTGTAMPAEISANPRWQGRANVLDPYPMYHWPVIDEVAEASRAGVMHSDCSAVATLPYRSIVSAESAATLIRRRRSAQRFDSRFVLARQAFYGLLEALLQRPGSPWDIWDFAPRLHPVIFVHRVEGLAPGLYALPRRSAVIDKLRAAMHGHFHWSKPPDAPAHLPLYQLALAGGGQLAKALHCHQAIAADGAFALGMVAEFDEVLTANPWRYRQLHWEAGLMGQALYLEAEALGLRGTGIGCYFDDSFHEFLGLSNSTFQSLYHFTVGYPMNDLRILTLPPYPDRAS